MTRWGPLNFCEFW